MPRKYLDQMVEEAEYANYQRWLGSHPNSVVSFNSSLHSEYLNYVNTNRYDSFSRGCYVPQYWLLPHISKTNKESYYLVKRNEQRIQHRNYRTDKYHTKENNYYRRGENRFDRENGGNSYSYPGKRWNDFTSTNHYAERHNDHRPPYNGRYRYLDSNQDEPHFYHQHNYRRYVHDRLEQPEYSDDLERTLDEEGSSRCPSVASVARGSSDENRPCEGKDPGIGETASASEVSVHSGATEITTQVAAWYNAEEQEQIVTMLREVNLRHDLQLQRDILNNKNELSCSDDSRNHDGQESASSSDEDDGINVILSSETFLPLPETIAVEELVKDYLSESESNCLEKLQPGFSMLSEKMIVENLVKKCVEEDNMAKDLSKLSEDCSLDQNKFVEDCTKDLNKFVDYPKYEGRKKYDGLTTDLNMSAEDCPEVLSKFEEDCLIDINKFAEDYSKDLNKFAENGPKDQNKLAKDCPKDLNKFAGDCSKDISMMDKFISTNDFHTFDKDLEVPAEREKIAKDTTNLVNEVCLKVVELAAGDSTVNFSSVLNEVTTNSEVMSNNSMQLSNENLTLTKECVRDTIGVTTALEDASTAAEIMSKQPNLTFTKECVQVKSHKKQNGISPVQGTSDKSTDVIGNVSCPITASNFDYASNEMQELPSHVRSDETILTLNDETVKKVPSVRDDSISPIQRQLKPQTVSANAAEFKPRHNLLPEFPLKLPKNLYNTPNPMANLKESVGEKEHVEQFKVTPNEANLVDKETRCGKCNFPPFSKVRNLPPIQNRSPQFNAYNVGGNVRVNNNLNTWNGPPAFSNVRQMKPNRGNVFEVFPKHYLFPKDFDASRRLGFNRDSNIFVGKPPPNFNVVRICSPNMGIQNNGQVQFFSTKLHNELNDNCKSFFWRKIPYFVQRTGIDRKQGTKSENRLIDLHSMADEGAKTAFSESHLPFKNAEVHYRRISVADLFKEAQKHEKTKNGNEIPESTVEDATSGNHQGFASASDHLKHILRIDSSSDKNLENQLNSLNSALQESINLTGSRTCTHLETKPAMANVVVPENGSVFKVNVSPEAKINRVISQSLSESKYNDAKYSERNKGIESAGTTKRYDKHYKCYNTSSRKSYNQRERKLDPPKSWKIDGENIFLVKDNENSSRNNNKCKDKTEIKTTEVKVPEKLFKDKENSLMNNVKTKSVDELRNEIADYRTAATKPKKKKCKNRNKSKANSESWHQEKYLSLASAPGETEDGTNFVPFEKKNIRGSLKKTLLQNEHSDSCISLKETTSSERDSLPQIMNYISSASNENIHKNQKNKNSPAVKENFEKKCENTTESKATNREKKADKYNSYFHQTGNYNQSMKYKNVEKGNSKGFNRYTSKPNKEMECCSSTENIAFVTNKKEVDKCKTDFSQNRNNHNFIKEISEKDNGKVEKTSSSKVNYEMERLSDTENKMTDKNKDKNAENVNKSNFDRASKFSKTQNKEADLKLNERVESSLEKQNTCDTKTKYEENRNFNPSKEGNKHPKEQRTKNNSQILSYSNQKPHNSRCEEEIYLCSRCQKFYNDDNYYERPRNYYYRSRYDYNTKYANDRSFRLRNRDTFEPNFTRKDSTTSNLHENEVYSKVDSLKDETIVSKSSNTRNKINIHLNKTSTSFETKLPSRYTNNKVKVKGGEGYNKNQDSIYCIHVMEENGVQKHGDTKLDHGKTCKEKEGENPENVRRNDEPVENGKQNAEQIRDDKIDEKPKNVKRNDEPVEKGKQNMERICGDEIGEKPKNAKQNDDSVEIDKRYEDRNSEEKVREPENVKQQNKPFTSDKLQHEIIYNYEIGVKLKRNDEIIESDKRHPEQTYNERVCEETEDIKQNDRHAEKYISTEIKAVVENLEILHSQPISTTLAGGDICKKGEESSILNKTNKNEIEKLFRNENFVVKEISMVDSLTKSNQLTNDCSEEVSRKNVPFQNSVNLNKEKTVLQKIDKCIQTNLKAPTENPVNSIHTEVYVCSNRMKSLHSEETRDKNVSKRFTDIYPDPTLNYQQDHYLCVKNMDKTTYNENCKLSHLHSEESSSLDTKEYSIIPSKESAIVVSVETPMTGAEYSTLGAKEPFSLGTESLNVGAGEINRSGQNPEMVLFGDSERDMMPVIRECPVDGIKEYFALGKEEHALCKAGESIKFSISNDYLVKSERCPIEDTKECAIVTKKEYSAVFPGKPSLVRAGGSTIIKADETFDGSEEPRAIGTGNSSIYVPKEPLLFGAGESAMLSTERYPLVNSEECSIIDTEGRTVVDKKEFSEVGPEKSSLLVASESTKATNSKEAGEFIILNTPNFPHVIPQECSIVDRREFAIVNTEIASMLKADESPTWNTQNGSEDGRVIEEKESLLSEAEESSKLQTTEYFHDGLEKKFVFSTEKFANDGTELSMLSTENTLLSNVSESAFSLTEAGLKESNSIEIKESFIIGTKEISFGSEVSGMLIATDLSLKECPIIDTEKFTVINSGQCSTVREKESFKARIEEFRTDRTPLISTKDSSMADAKDNYTTNIKESILVGTEGLPAFSKSSRFATEGSHISKVHTSEMNMNETKVGTYDDKCPNSMLVPNVKTSNIRMYDYADKISCHETSALKDCKIANENLNWLERNTSIMVKKNNMLAKEARFKVSSSGCKSPEYVSGFSKSDTCLLQKRRDSSRYDGQNGTQKNKSFLLSNNYKVLLGEKKLGTKEASSSQAKD